MYLDRYHQFHYFENKAGRSDSVLKSSDVPNLSSEIPHEEVYAYDATMDVEGVITLSIPPGKKVEHMGMRVEFVGRIDMVSLKKLLFTPLFQNTFLFLVLICFLQQNLFLPLKCCKSTVAFEGRPHYDFISLSKELEAPMTIYDHMRTYPFRFGNIEKVYETYHGKNVSVRYFVRVAMERKFLPPLVREHEIIVQSCQPEMELKQSDAIKMEVGIEDCLHIEFEYSKRHFHLEDVIYGKVHFLLVSFFLSTPWYP